MKEMLESWGTKYVEEDIKDGRAKALIIKGGVVPKIPKKNLDENPVVEDESVSKHPVLVKARRAAEAARDKKVWPLMYFSADGFGRPALKRYLDFVKKGKVPMTYWADDDYDDPLVLGSQSWEHEESGHSQTGINELNALVGKGHGFDTVKPLKLMKKIAQLWCPPNGLVLDPYAGSGTTGHAVLELNNETGSDRRFILIEQGSPENGDKYARSLTWERLKNAITGLRLNQAGKLTKSAAPLGGGFEFRMLTNQIDAKTVLSMRRDELVDVVITSHWETGKRGAPTLIRIDEPKNFTYL